MIWQNSMAWLGLATLAIPIIIHLLARRNARTQKFPTLRFLAPRPIIQARRHKLSELLLLAVRVAVLLAAVAALASPLFLTAERRLQLDNTLSRVIIVDTSGSMNGATQSGATALVVARATSQAYADSAGSSLIVETAAPATELAAAAELLGYRGGKRELVVVSDFQTGSIDATDVATLPENIGIRMIRAATAPPDAQRVSLLQTRDSETWAEVSFGERTSLVSWDVLPRAGRNAALPFAVLADSLEMQGSGAALAAAVALGAPASALTVTTRNVAIVQPLYERRFAILQSVVHMGEPWMFDVVARISAGSILAAAAAPGVVSPDARAIAMADTLAHDAALVVVARNHAGAPLVVAGAAQLNGATHLMLFSRAQAGSLVNAALVSETMHAVAERPALHELEPGRLSDSLLSSWQRAPGTVVMADDTDKAGASDGRWFWLLALVLIAAELLLRRITRRAGPPAGAAA